MKTGPIIAIIIIIILAALIIWWAYQANEGYQPAMNSTSTSYPSSTNYTGNPPSSLPTFDQTISDNIISVMYPSSDFGLATNRQQVLSSSTIPPCDSPFNYCLYYIGSAYQNTLESAGIRIAKRPGLATQNSCLTTQPSGYTKLTTTTATSSDYAVSEFGSPTAPLSNAAAGSYANDVIYRLFYQPSSTCYEFQTRVAQSQFANYPSGTIQQFTADDQAILQSEINAILATLTLPSGEVVMFPQ